MEDSKKSGRDTLWKILVCVALLVFLVSGGLTLRSYLADKRAQEEYERLAREAAQTTQETITIEETEKQESYFKQALRIDVSGQFVMDFRKELVNA